uniref:Transposable element P transposase n=1 Tax=Schizaphis graminum TaxID=13262 RepID=A0A2S2PM39_SCHGA
MCTSLGANFNLGHNAAFFSSNHPKNEKMFCFYDDPSHMIKLVQNAFGDKKIIVNGNGQKIRWDYIQKLYEKENCGGLRAATKLQTNISIITMRKMNVRLAAQLLSNSVCDALLYLNGSYPNFEGYLATAEFCLIFNNAFDILNSRKQLSIKPFNSSINENTFKNIVIS